MILGSSETYFDLFLDLWILSCTMTFDILILNVSYNNIILCKTELYFLMKSIRNVISAYTNLGAYGCQSTVLNKNYTFGFSIIQIKMS